MVNKKKKHWVKHGTYHKMNICLMFFVALDVVVIHFLDIYFLVFPYMWNMTMKRFSSSFVCCEGEFELMLQAMLGD